MRQLAAKVALAHLSQWVKKGQERGLWLPRSGATLQDLQGQSSSLNPFGPGVLLFWVLCQIFPGVNPHL
jgi:hypothetical protein